MHNTTKTPLLSLLFVGIALASPLSAATVKDSTFKLKNHWYSQSAKITAMAKRPISFESAACRNQFNTKDYATDYIEPASFVERDLALTTNDQFNAALGLSEVLFRDYTQFWQHQGKYYQLSAVWDHDVPASYRIEFYRSDDKHFTQAIEQLTIDNINMAQVDAIAVEQVFADMHKHFTIKGAKAGSNIKVALLQDNSHNHFEVTLLNDSPVILAGQNLYCSTNDTLQQLHCRCDNSTSHRH